VIGGRGAGSGDGVRRPERGRRDSCGNGAAERDAYQPTAADPRRVRRPKFRQRRDSRAWQRNWGRKMPTRFFIFLPQCSCQRVGRRCLVRPTLAPGGPRSPVRETSGVSFQLAVDQRGLRPQPKKSKSLNRRKRRERSSGSFSVISVSSCSKRAQENENSGNSSTWPRKLEAYATENPDKSETSAKSEIQRFKTAPPGCGESRVWVI